jgi:hypothetical protein
MVPTHDMEYFQKEFDPCYPSLSPFSFLNFESDVYITALLSKVATNWLVFSVAFAS